jgi:hypothetical protein
MTIPTPKTSDQPIHHSSVAGKVMTYISEFDGVKKEFSLELEQQFNNLYHEEYCNKTAGSPNNIDDLRQLHKELFNLGARASVEQFGFVEASCFLFTCHIICEGRSLVIHNLVAVKDNKIIRAQAVGDLENMEIYHRNIH